MPAKRQNQAGPSVQKRTRFDALPPKRATSTSENEDDIYLEADLPSNSQRAKQRAKRVIKESDGYGSDSSNDEDESVVPSRHKKEDEDEGDVDMFGSDVEDDSSKGKGKGKGKGKDDGIGGKGKEKEFLDKVNIEGEEEGNVKIQEDEDEEELNSEEEHDKRRKEGLDGDMGYELTAFNMKIEEQEGKLTADGDTYVTNEKDPLEKHDNWLTDIDKDAIVKARRAHRERERIEKEREEQEMKDLGSEEKKEEEERIMQSIVDFMERGETVLESLQRLGSEQEERRKKEEKEQGKKLSWAEKQKQRKAARSGMNGDSEQPSNPFTTFSNLISTLSTLNSLDVYSLSKESIQRMIPSKPEPQGTNGHRRQNSTSDPSQRDSRAFQYRFSMKYMMSLPEDQRPVERALFGPFSAQQLSQWRNTGFFGGPACENVEIRLIEKEGPGEWGNWNNIVAR